MYYTTISLLLYYILGEYLSKCSSSSEDMRKVELLLSFQDERSDCLYVHKVHVHCNSSMKCQHYVLVDPRVYIQLTPTYSFASSLKPNAYIITHPPDFTLHTSGELQLLTCESPKNKAIIS